MCLIFKQSLEESRDQCYDLFFMTSENCLFFVLIKGTFHSEIPIVKMMSKCFFFWLRYFIVSCSVRLTFSDACNLRSVYFVSEHNLLELEVTLGER